MNNEIERIIIDEGYFTETDYPFTIKHNFSALGSIIKRTTQCPLVSFSPNDSIIDLLGFDANTLYEEYNLSPIPVDLLSFDNTFLECDIAQGLTGKGKSGIIHTFTMDVESGYNYIERFRTGVHWYMIKSKISFQALISNQK